MTVPFEAPEVTLPLRAIVLGAATQGWYQADDAERGEVILPALVAAMRDWQAMGARLIASLDDDLFMVGEPRSTGFSWYLMFEIPSLDIAAAMMQRFRAGGDGARLDRFFRLEIRFGRPFFPLER
ncbi:MAG: hypothetical protein KatS3mg118_2004 [Paracoccaceae bacterium]|nr:MAG: hypothetical protein KatS3mg118_2004 [Paracoccaceae bacterium]